MLEPSMLEKLRSINQRYGIRPSEQIRRAIAEWVVRYQEMPGGVPEEFIPDPPPGSKKSQARSPKPNRARLKVIRKRKVH